MRCPEYDPTERVVVYTIDADGTTSDILETTIGALVAVSHIGGDISDLLDEAIRDPLSGAAGGWRLVDTN